MEYGQQLGSIESRLKESNRKIEDLAYIVKSLTYSFQESGINTIKPDMLSKMESQLEKISRQSSNENIENFLQEMRKNLDEKQRFLTSKVDSLENTMFQLGQYIEKKAGEIQNDSEISKNFEVLKSGISKFYLEFDEAKANFTYITSKIDEFSAQNSKIQDITLFINELMPFLEKFYGNFEVNFQSVNEKFSALSSLISSFDPTDEIRSLKTDVDSLNVTINTVLSAIQLIDFKYKDIQDSFSKISTSKDIQSLQLNLNNVFERFNSLNEVLKLAATGVDVEELKREISTISANLDAFKQLSLHIDKQNKEIIEGNLTKLDDRMESILTILSDSKSGNTDITERINEIYSKFDGFQGILLKLLALDNVDVVKKDIREVFIKLNSINENFSTIADAKSTEEIKEETISLSAKLVELRDFINIGVLDNLKILSGDFGIVSEKVEQILALERDDSKIIDIKNSVDNIDINIKNANKTLEQLSELSKLDEILEKVEQFPENDDIYTIKEDLNFLVSQISKENDKVRGDLFLLQNGLSSFLELTSNFAKAEDISVIKEDLNTFLIQITQENDKVRGDLSSLQNDLTSYVENISNLVNAEDILKINNSVKESENILKDEICGLGDRFLEYVYKANETNFGTVNNKLDGIENIKQLLISKLVDFENSINSKVTENNEQNHQQILENIDVLKSELQGLGDRFLEYLHKSNETNFGNVNQNFDAINNKLVDIQNVQQTLSSKLTDFEMVLKSETSDINEKNYQQIQETIEKFRENVSQISEFSKENLDISLIETKIDELSHSLNFEKTEEIIEDLKLSLLSEQRASKEQLLQKFDSVDVSKCVDNIFSKINENQNILNEIIELSQKSFGDKHYDSNVILSEVESLKDAINYQLNDLRSDFSVFSDFKKDFSEVATLFKEKSQDNNSHMFKEELLGEFKNLSDKIENVIKSESSVVDDKLLEGHLENTKSDLIEIKNNIEKANENIKNSYSYSKNIYENIDLLKNEIDTFKATISSDNLDLINHFDKIEQKVSEININFDEIAQKEDLTKIEQILDKYSQTFNELAKINDVAELKDNLSKLEENFVLQLVQLFENISFLEESEEIKNCIEQVRDELASQVDTLASSIDSFDNDKSNSIIEKIDVLSQKIESVENSNQNLSDLLTSIQGNSSDDIQYSLGDVESDFAKVRLDLHDIANAVAGYTPGHNLTESLVFADESEKIKNCIDSAKYDLINRIHSLADSFDSFEKEKFNSVSNLLISLKGDSKDDIIYSLEDIQSDFAKMRLLLFDIAKATTDYAPEQEFTEKIQNISEFVEKLNSDISEIGMRTNKLILSSDESNNDLKNNLQTFKEMFEKTNPEKIYELFYEFSFSLQDLKQKLENITNKTESANNTSQTVKYALGHLGEWVDSAGILLENIKNDVASIKKVNSLDLSEIVKSNSFISDEVNKISSTINNLEQNLTDLSLNDKTEQLNHINTTKGIIIDEVSKINDKFVQLEAKFDDRLMSLEEKIQELTAKSSPSRDEEIKPLLEYIASQASAANENARINNHILRRVENLESKLNSFEHDIKKIVYFVEEV